MLATLTSKKLTLWLLAVLALTLIPASVSKSPLFVACGRLLITLLAINLTLCTWRHWRRLSASVLLVHAGVLAILGGTLWSRAGFVATSNVYEGDAITSAFRWDRQQDTPLGFALEVKKIHRDYYPALVRVGVIMDGNPSKLYELRINESFTHAGYQVDLLDFDPVAPTLRLSVISPDGLRTQQTATKEPPASQPGLVCQLVAFQTPIVKRSWLDIEITPEAAAPISGHAEVNHPLKWQGLRFYHTATDADPDGRAYAGVQIVSDHGIPLVYLGFMLVCLGNLLLLLQKMGHRPRHHSTGDPDPNRV